jgi:hypothetical protein
MCIELASASMRRLIFAEVWALHLAHFTLAARFVKETFVLALRLYISNDQVSTSDIVVCMLPWSLTCERRGEGNGNGRCSHSYFHFHSGVDIFGHRRLNVALVDD